MRMTRRMRAMALGRPKAGKTPLLAGAANAGFRIAMLDFDGNGGNLLHYVRPEAQDRVSIIPLRDRMFRRGDGMVSPLGRTTARVEPQAWLKAGRALDNWGKLDPDHDWGEAGKWGPDTILVLDSLTGGGDAAFALALFNNNRDFGRIRRQDWQSAMKMEDGLLEDLVGPYYNCHLYVTAHLKLIGPKTEDDGQDDDDDLKDARHAIAKAQAQTLPTRYYPTALGRALPQEILRRVPATVLVESTSEGRRVWTRPPPGMPIDLGVPGLLKGKPLAASLDYETAFLDIMEVSCGYRTPPKGETE
jgi:hypothetical protein